MFDSAYPRPQFVRKDWFSLDGPWLYSFCETESPAEVDWQGNIIVPYPPEAPLSEVADPGYHRVIWYRRTVRLPSGWSGQRILLHFGAVDYAAKVWVNGQLVAEHEGGHTPFQADITGVLLPGEQVILVRAEDDPVDLEQPRGKQDWQPEPHSIWYPRTTGIWQPVWLEPVPQTYLKQVRITPALERLALDLQVRLFSPGDLTASGITLHLELSHAGQLLAQADWDVQQAEISGSLQIDPSQGNLAREDLFWSPENPVLMDLNFSLLRNERCLDRVESYAALRSVEARAGRFYLNGQPYFLQMVLDQGYWPESHLAAPSSAALRRDVEVTKALGFNGARKHQKIEDPRYLYWADRLGLLVWDELPSAYRFSDKSARRLMQEFVAMIDRDYNHPCVVAWVPFNESWGIPDVRKSQQQRNLAQSLYYTAKALDPSRLVVDNDGWEHCSTDLLTIHDYVNQPEVYQRRYGSQDGLKETFARQDVDNKLLVEGFSPDGLPVILSEFGGIRYGQGSGWGYQQVQTEEELVNCLTPLMFSAYGAALSGYCYTQLTDTFQEQNGLLYADRRPKVDPGLFARVLREGLDGWRKRALEGNGNKNGNDHGGNGNGSH